VTSSDRGWAPTGLAAIFAVSGILHFARPDLYRPLVPRALPAAGPIVAASGLGELICAAGLLGQRRWARHASAALLLAVLPGNVQFALDRTAEAGADPRLVLGAWLRLPLQLPLIWAALQRPRPR